MQIGKAFIFIVLFCLLCHFSVSQARCERRASIPRTLAIGHRGFLKNAPENTIPSFKMALDACADGIETDLRVTKDGKIVLFHDETLDRTTNCTGLLSNWLWDDLKYCDAGSWFSDEFIGTRIPEMSELLNLIKTHEEENKTNVFVVMDIKDLNFNASRLVPIVKEFSMESRVIASCWTQQQLDSFAQYFPIVARQVLSARLEGDWKDEEFWESMLEKGVRGFSLAYPTITPDFVDAAHRRLSSVVSWTVDAEADMKSCIVAGHDGIITNDVATLIEAISSYPWNNHRHFGGHYPGSHHRDDEDQNPGSTWVSWWAFVLISIGSFCIGAIGASTFYALKLLPRFEGKLPS